MSNEGADVESISEYRNNTLPVLAHYDDAQKLTVVSILTVHRYSLKRRAYDMNL